MMNPFIGYTAKSCCSCSWYTPVPNLISGGEAVYIDGIILVKQKKMRETPVVLLLCLFCFPLFLRLHRRVRHFEYFTRSSAAAKCYTWAWSFKMPPLFSTIHPPQQHSHSFRTVNFYMYVEPGRLSLMIHDDVVFLLNPDILLASCWLWRR